MRVPEKLRADASGDPAGQHEKLLDPRRVRALRYGQHAHDFVVDYRHRRLTVDDQVSANPCEHLFR